MRGQYDRWSENGVLTGIQTNQSCHFDSSCLPRPRAFLGQTTLGASGTGNLQWGTALSGACTYPESALSSLSDSRARLIRCGFPSSRSLRILPLPEASAVRVRHISVGASVTSGIHRWIMTALAVMTKNVCVRFGQRFTGGPPLSYLGIFFLFIYSSAYLSGVVRGVYHLVIVALFLEATECNWSGADAARAASKPTAILSTGACYYTSCIAWDLTTSHMSAMSRFILLVVSATLIRKAFKDPTPSWN